MREVLSLDKASDIEDSYPLSPLQHGMLFNTLLEPGSGVDVEQLFCALLEDLDVPVFQRAWRRAIARHPVLRTSLRWENLEEPQQDVHTQVELPWQEQDWREAGTHDRDERLVEFLAADRRRGFDLTGAPLYRLTLLRWGRAEYRFIWTFHHSILEGRSYLLVLREVFAFYAALRSGRDIELPLPPPYRHYIEWLRERDFSRDETFWRMTLQGFTAPTPLAIEHAMGTVHDRRPGHGNFDLRLPAQITSELRALALGNRLTLNTVVQGAWALLLSRYSGEADVVFGVIRANRRATVAGAEAMVGLFLNTLPLRVRVNREAMLLEWLREVRSQWTAMHEHAHAPLAKVQGWSEVAHDRALFKSTVMFENFDMREDAHIRDGAAAGRRFDLALQTSYLLDLAAYDGSELRLRLDFDRRRIDAAAAARMLAHLRTLLCGIAARPQCKVRELELLDPAERHQLLVGWNQTGVEYPAGAGACLHELFEAQAGRTPAAVAVVFEHRHLTYDELNRRANRLAHHLREAGVGPDVPVAICAERSLEMVVGLLAVLKAGGAFVPVDPGYPAARVAFMLNDINAPVVLAQHTLIDLLPVPAAARVVDLDDARWTAAGNTANPPLAVTGANLAYIIYTSGSTGTPKGAMIPHRAIVNHLQWMHATFPLDANDAVLQKTEFSFDVAVWEFFAPLHVGARLVVARAGGHQDPAYLAQAIVDHRITVLQLVPSLLRMLLVTREFTNCASLRHVFCGGEVMTADLPRLFYAALDARLHNMYGPTEAAIDSLYYSVPPGHGGDAVPIGRPVANTHAYVLDAHREPVPVGVPGELYLGGAQVGCGYYNQPALSAASFIPDIFCAKAGGRLYRTGDLVRYLPDGNLEFLGRVDEQVKLRGFRIELGEIESALRQHPSVREVAVVMSGSTAPDQRLAAYVTVAGSPPAATELRSFLKQRLPEYMVPAALVVLDRLPLTANGKLDRQALPAPNSQLHETARDHIAPRRRTEQLLADIWASLFQLSAIGVRDNFFDLGGDSLMLVALIDKINRRLGVSVSVPQLFRNPTLEQMALVIDRQRPRLLQPAVYRLKEGRSAPAVYFIYAGPDEYHLAQRMQAGHDVLGIQVPWPLAWREAVAANQQAAFPDMQQLVALYVTALSSHAKSSSCVVAGHSFAGLIAFEVARQLQQQGARVELVMLIDTWARLPGHYEIAACNLRNCWRASSGKPAGRRIIPALAARLRRSLSIARLLLRQEKNRARDFWRRIAPISNQLTTLTDEQGMPLDGELLTRLYAKLREDYRPQPLDARGILFRAGAADDYAAARELDPQLGWKNLFGRGLEVVPVSGDHLSIIRGRDSPLAPALDRILERDWPDRTGVPPARG